MALTIRGLAAIPELGIDLLVPGRDVDHPITWVHVSELDDPTQFLSGGELLLTTGLGPGAHADADRYVERLSEADVVGLGFGVGLGHDRVPGELVSAAAQARLALLEVPRSTPFIAISRSVSRALAADEYAAVTRTFTAQQELTKAALSAAGPARLLRLLARQVDAWVALLDPAGSPIVVHPDTARRRLPAVAEEVLRLRGHRGSVGSGFTVQEDAVSLQPVGTGARRRAYLAVGKPGPLTAAERHLVNAAVLLLTLGLEQGPSLSDQVASDQVASDQVPSDQVAVLRAGVLELALHGSFDRARAIARQAGSPIPAEPLAVLVGRARAGQSPQIPEIPELHGTFVAVEDASVTVLVTAGAASTAADALAAAGFATGVSGAVPPAELAQAHRQAGRAADAAAARGGGSVQRFPDLASGGLTGLLEPAQAGAFADSLLRPLLEHDRTGRGDLVVSLRTWLAHHGQWDPSAAALGVHRHTVRNRIRTAGRLLDTDLDSPTVRSELWLALELLDR